MDADLRRNVLLSAMRAMLGAVTYHLRGVTIDYNKDVLLLRAYFDKGANENDKELINIALSEIIADLWQEISEFRYEPVDLPFPGEMKMLKEWIFLRHEENKVLL